jgi:hypothetical protein
MSSIIGVATDSCAPRVLEPVSRTRPTMTPQIHPRVLRIEATRNLAEVHDPHAARGHEPAFGHVQAASATMAIQAAAKSTTFGTARVSQAGPKASGFRFAC